MNFTNCFKRLPHVIVLSRQNLLIMKLLSFFMIVFSLQVSASSFSQNVTLDAEGMSLSSVFSEIKRQTGYVFWYDKNLIDNHSSVAVKFDRQPLEKVLSSILSPLNLDFAIEKKVIVIKSKPVRSAITDTTKPKTPPGEIRGRVMNENGDPVLATITVKGTSQGANTNDNGQFTLSDVAEDATLIISGVGLVTKEIQLNGKKNLYISLKIAVTPLEETVIKGYYSTTKRFNTGNVATVKAVDIQKQPVSNPLEAISGRMAGVYIQQTTGTSGGGFNIEIRGVNSLRQSLGGNNGNLPLFIVDGVQITSASLDQYNGLGGQVTPLVSPLNTISPSDIESIEILKDADATAIYGSRGANGVVLITTKKGKAGKTKVDVNFYTGAGKVARKMDLLNTEQYMQMRHEAFANDNITSIPTFAWDMTGYWDTTRYTDWQKTLIGNTSHMTRADVSLSGGTQLTQFLFGASYFRQSTVFPGDFADKKASAHFSLNHLSENKRFTSSLTVNYVVDKNNLPMVDPTNAALTLPPVAPSIYNPDGTLNWANQSWPNLINPYAPFLRPYDATTNNLIANSQLSYQIISGLHLRTSLGYNKMQLDQTRLTPISSLYNPNGTATGSAAFAYQNYTSWIVEPQLEYQRKISKGDLSVLVGSTFQQNLTDAQVFNTRGVTSDALLSNPGAAPTTSPGQLTYIKYRYNAVFGRINYNWDNKYLVNLTGRRDGSSRFGPGKQFANFGAVGLGWIFSSERFFEHHLPMISYGKIRASYGTTGNDQIPDYGYLNTYTPTSYPYNATGGLLVNGLFNPDFAWETNKKAEAGLELGFVKDRLLLSGSFYRNRSSNQLVGYPLPTITGQSSLQYYNLPATVENKGWEFDIRTINLNGKSLSWTSSINITFPKNKLIAYPGLEKSSYANTYVVGKSLNVSKAYHFLGVDPQTGVYLFEDLNKDNKISYPDDLQAYKSLDKKYYGGVANNFKYKNLQLDIFFQFVKQTGYNYLKTFSAPGTIRNQPTYVLNRWQPSQTTTGIQKYTQAMSGTAAASAFSNIVSSDASLSDASFIRLKNVYLSYQLPSAWLSRMKAQSAKVFVQGQNLITITHYMGLDPESQNFYAVPPLRMFTAGIQITL